MAEFYTFLCIGGFLIVFEVLVGFSVFWYLLLGLSCILTALTTQIFPGWEAALLSFVIYTTASVAIMLKWIRPAILLSKKDSWHSLIGQLTEVSADILPGAQGGSVRWSGVEWKARLVKDSDAQLVSKGQSVIVDSISGTTLFVRPVNNGADGQPSGPPADGSVKKTGSDGLSP